MTRRQFAVASIATGAGFSQPAGGRFIKGICSIAFPKDMPVTGYFAAARSAGFDAVEIPLGDTIAMDTPADKLKTIADLAAKEKVQIASVWVSAPLSANPLNSPDAEKRARGVETLKRAIDIASDLRCEAMLLVPGRLGSAKLQVGYQDTWDRVTLELRKAVPYAEQKKVCITPENVWNKFLVSPLEMRAFVDQFHSSWLQMHFDTGNVMQFGFPEDWILTLGPRIRRLHLKDYKLSARAEQGRFVDLLEGDVDWKAVMAALVKVGYRGFVSPEYGPDPKDPDRLKKLSAATDKILAMA